MRFSSSRKNGTGRLLQATQRQLVTKVHNRTETANVAHQSGQAIAAQHIDMVYRTGNQSQTVLKDISLNIGSGTIQLLMGPSGSGKTTLLSILGGILSPTQGTVSLLGTDITSLSKRQLAKFRLNNIGFIFQGFNLFDALTAVENIVVALKMKGVRPRAARQEALYWLDQVGLADKAHHLPKNLSGGQKQRVAIARALAGNPPLIMADEPTAALDSHSGHVVIEMLCNLAKQNDRTVLMVTHDPRIQSVADQVTYLEDGQLQSPEASSTDELHLPQPQPWPRSA
ncbi:MAG: ABC transporter ATP-binding protein [Cyanothece sp. SIO2G6]|nr:ABC transporter ATP-binding protein [Cyanothece sp. SIO2G6]